MKKGVFYTVDTLRMPYLERRKRLQYQEVSTHNEKGLVVIHPTVVSKKKVLLEAIVADRNKSEVPMRTRWLS